MTKAAIAGLLALVAAAAWMFAAAPAEARVSAVPDAQSGIDRTANPETDCPNIIERSTRRIGGRTYIIVNGGYMDAYPYSEELWRDCDGTATVFRRTYRSHENPPPDIANPYSGTCAGYKIVTNETIDQRVNANGRTEYLWRDTERSCGRQTAQVSQWSVCGLVQSIAPEILQRGRHGATALYRVRVVTTFSCGSFTTALTNEYWTNSVPAVYPAPSDSG